LGAKRGSQIDCGVGQLKVTAADDEEVRQHKGTLRRYVEGCLSATLYRQHLLMAPAPQNIKTYTLGLKVSGLPVVAADTGYAQHSFHLRLTIHERRVHSLHVHQVTIARSVATLELTSRCRLHITSPRVSRKPTQSEAISTFTCDVR
jgi:hypothetical protein